MSLLKHTLKCILSLWMSVITMTFKIGRQQIVKISFLYFKQSGFVSMTLCPNYNFCCCCCRRWWLNFIAMREYTIIKSINLFHGKCKRIKYHRMRLFILVQFRIIVCSVKQFNRCFYSFFSTLKNDYYVRTSECIKTSSVLVIQSILIDHVILLFVLFLKTKLRDWTKFKAIFVWNFIDGC